MYRLTSNTHDAEDLTQQAMLQGLENLQQFQPGSNMRSWLLRIATNCFLDHKRRRRPTAMDATVIDQSHLAPSSGTLSTPLEDLEMTAQVHKALMQIPDTQRAVFVLRTTEELSFRDIAQVLGTTEVTARWHMLQARQRLLEILEGKL